MPLAAVTQFHGIHNGEHVSYDHSTRLLRYLDSDTWFQYRTPADVLRSATFIIELLPAEGCRADAQARRFRRPAGASRGPQQVGSTLRRWRPCRARTTTAVFAAEE